MLHWIESWLAHDIAYRLLAEMRIELYRKLDSLAPAYLVRRRSGDLIALASQDIETIEYFFAHTVAPALVALLVPSAVLVTLAISIRERHRPDGVQLTALAMAVMGMAVVVLGQLDPAAGVRFELIGLGLALLAGAAQTFFVLVSRRGYAAIPTDEATLVILGGGMIGYLVIAVVIGDLGALTAPFSTPAGWPFLLLAGTVGAGIPSLLFLTAVRWIGGVRTGILAMFEPVTGTLLAAVLLGEALRPVQALGGALILGAGLLLQRSRALGVGHGPGGARPVPTRDAAESGVEPVPLV